MRNLLLLLPLIVSLAACDTLEPEGHTSQVFVESYQVAGEPLQQVRLTWTSPVDGSYDPVANAVREADVVVELLREDGTVEAAYPYREQLAGVYVAVDAEATVQPLRRYRLRATPPDGTTVAATTLVPNLFGLLDASADTVVYQGDEQLEIRVTRSTYPGRQNVYIFRTEALAPTEGNLTPIYRNFLEDDEGNIDPDDLADLRALESPPFNEANYEVVGDVVTVRLPWLTVAFFGQTRLSMNALDDNLYDFVRSVMVQRDGGAGLSPGEIASLLETVEGGTGIFGSYAKSELTVFIAR